MTALATGSLFIQTFRQAAGGVYSMNLKENLSTETVDRLNLRKAITMSPDKTVRDAVLAMREGELGCVIVVDDDAKAVGIFTEAMLRLAVCRDANCVSEPLTDHMTTTFPWVATDDPIETVLAAMEAKNHRFVVVVDGEGQVTGLTGQKGLMEYVAEHFPEQVMVQRVGSEPYPAKREGA